MTPSNTNSGQLDESSSNAGEESEAQAKDAIDKDDPGTSSTEDAAPSSPQPDSQRAGSSEENAKKPTIYIKSPHFYFNITKSAAFENIIFDGIDAFSHIVLDEGKLIANLYWP